MSLEFLNVMNYFFLGITLISTMGMISMGGIIFRLNLDHDLFKIIPPEANESYDLGDLDDLIPEQTYPEWTKHIDIFIERKDQIG